MEATTMSNLLFWMILITLFWVGFFVIPRVMVRRAVLQVLNIFRQSHTLYSEIPKTVEELGLEPRGLTDRLFRSRDYKPYALQILINSGMVRLTEGGKMCLLENKTPEFQQTGSL